MATSISCCYLVFFERRIPFDFYTNHFYPSRVGQRNVEAFLEDAFDKIQPISEEIGRVMIAPNYTVTADELDHNGLSDELARCIRQHKPDLTALRSPQGDDIPISQEYPLLRKYVRTITLYKEAGIGSWVQIEPPGNFV